MIKKIKYIIWLITSPSYWIMNYKYDKRVDDLFSELLDKYDFKETERSPYFFSIGGHWVWCANRPYACFNIGGYYNKFRPSRLTIRKGIKKLESQFDLKNMEIQRDIYFDKLKNDMFESILNKYK